MCYFSADNRVLEHFRLKLRTKVVLDTLADMLCKFADYKSSLLSIAKISIIAVPIYHSDNFSPFFIEQHRVKKTPKKDLTSPIIFSRSTANFTPKFLIPLFLLMSKFFEFSVFHILPLFRLRTLARVNFVRFSILEFFW